MPCQPCLPLLARGTRAPRASPTPTGCHGGSCSPQESPAQSRPQVLAEHGLSGPSSIQYQARGSKQVWGLGQFEVCLPQRLSTAWPGLSLRSRSFLAIFYGSYPNTQESDTFLPPLLQTS